MYTLQLFLLCEWTLLKRGAGNIDVPALAKADAGFGIAAAAVLITGICRVTLGAKPVSFYLHNPVFHTKISLFVLVGLLSIWPTIAFIRWRKAAANDPHFQPRESEWRKAKRFLLIELHLVALIPLAAVIMARGIGYAG